MIELLIYFGNVVIVFDSVGALKRNGQLFSINNNLFWRLLLCSGKHFPKTSTNMQAVD